MGAVSTNTPYRKNVRDYDERMRRKIDYLFYVNPLVRFAFVVSILLPPVLVYEARHYLPVHPVLVALCYLAGGAVAALSVIQNVYSPDKQPRRFFLMVVWWPLACVWFLVSWILFGRILRGAS